MRKNINTETIQGYLWDKSGLSIKQVQNEKSANYGKEYISGKLAIAVDEDAMNVIEIHYNYVSPTYSNNKPNNSYSALKKIIEEGKEGLKVGISEATKISTSPSLLLNEWYNEDEDRMISTQENNGGFVNIVTVLKDNVDDRATFTTDALLTKIRTVEPKNEADTEKTYISGYVFNFKNEIFPVEFRIDDPSGIDYFNSLEPSLKNPVYTQVWGKIISTTVTTSREIKSAFGDVKVVSTPRTEKAWVIVGAREEVYPLGQEGILTAEELQTAVQNREVYLAEKKSSTIARKTNNASTPTAAPTTFGGITPNLAINNTGEFVF